MKQILLATALAVFTTQAQADTRRAVITHVQPNYTNTTVQVPETQCETVQVPVYGTVTREGNAGAGALTGMIIGGLIGDAANGSDGAAAGAVIGGIIGANNSQTRTESVITGYRNEHQCTEVLVNQTERQIRNYTVTYEWNNIQGQSYTHNHYRVGDRIRVTVSINAQ